MRAFATLAFALTLAAGNALAADPPSRVGRIAWTEGEVAAWLESDRGWEKAYVNTPLTSENSLWTEPGSRAEVRIGSTAIRLDEATQLDMRRLEDELLRAHVVRGSVSVRIRHFEPNDRYTLSTPQARFQLIANGRFRIDAEEDSGESRLTVFAGSANLVASGRRITVNAGESVRVYAEGGGFDFERAAARDFDNWSLARDERLSDRQSSRYVSPQMTGYEDLDEYGSWSSEPEYGAVWYPSRIGVDWAPYRTGHWAWVRPWGWTWIDDSPWGYAPFHYGRWVHIGNRWGWCPGRYIGRPVWAPALVGWVGGANWSLTVSSRHAPVVGWYPLAPWDRYQPWYTNNTTYINNVNVVVVKPPRTREHDRDHNRIHGASVVPRDGFVSRKPVAGALIPVPRDVVAAQPVVTGASVLPPRSEVPRMPFTPGPPAGLVPPSKPASRGEPASGAPSALRVQPSGRVQPAQAPSAPVQPSAPSAPVQPSAPARTEPSRSASPAELRSKPPARVEPAPSPSSPTAAVPPAAPRAPAAAPRSPAYREPPAASSQPVQRGAPAPRVQPKQPEAQPQSESKPVTAKPAREDKPVATKPAREDKPVTAKPQKDKD